MTATRIGLGWLAMAGCTACPPSVTVPLPPMIGSPGDPGPAAMARVAAGYELRNRSVRVVIDPATGDVVQWGPLATTANVAAARRGIYAAVAGLPLLPPTGSVEARDSQTWQFYGSDANAITWRKIYNLDHASLLVSFIVQNNGPTTRPVQVQLCGPTDGLTVAVHDAEQFTAAGAVGTISVHGWNIAHGGPPLAPPVWVQSDVFQLKPAERQGCTTEWRLILPSEEK